MLPAISVFARKLDHRVLHEVQRFITIANRNLRDAQCTLFNLLQKPIEALFPLQRSNSRMRSACARYRKNSSACAHSEYPASSRP